MKKANRPSVSTVAWVSGIKSSSIGYLLSFSVAGDDNCNLQRWSLFIDAADATELDASVTAAWNNTLPEEEVEEPIEE